MSVLVFCATKKWCKTTATLLANEILSERSRAEAAVKANTEAKRNVLAKVNPSSVRTKNGVLPIIRPGHGERSDRPQNSADLEASDAPRQSPSMCSRPSGEIGKLHRSGGKDGACPAAGFVSAKSVVGEGVRDAALHPDPHDRTRDGRDLVQDGSTSRSRGSLAKVTVPSQGNSDGNGPTIITAELAAARVRERLRQTPVGLDADLAHLVRMLSMRSAVRRPCRLRVVEFFFLFPGAGDVHYI